MQKSPHLFVPISDRGAELFRVCLIVLVCAFFLWQGVFTVPRAGADWVSMVGPGGGRGRGGGRAGPKQWNVLLISQVVTNPGVSPLGEWGRGMGEIRGDQQVGGGCLGIEGQLRGDNPRLQ